MKIRADIAELLHQGLPDSHIAAALHCDAHTVARARTALGLPKARRGRPAATLDELIAARTRPTDDGHLEWTGHTQDRRPFVRHRGRLLSVRKLQFVAHHGREPVGYVRPGCGYHGCVEGSHLDDRTIRERDNAAYEAIFGEVPA